MNGRGLIGLGLGGLLCGCTAFSPVTEDGDLEKAAQINLQLGVSYIQNQRFDLAEEKLKKALEQNYRLVEARNGLGVLYEELGRLPEAREQFELAQQLDGQNILVKSNYARFLCRDGTEAARGEALFTEVAQQPGVEAPWNAWIGAGGCARQQGDFVRAEQHYRQALALNTRAVGALWELATLLHDRKQYEQAQQQLDNYHRIAPISPPSLWLGVTIARAQGNRSAETAYADALRTQFPNSPETRRL